MLMKVAAPGVLAFLITPSLALSQDPSPPLGPRFADIDESHSIVEFTVRHLGFTKIRGHFEDWNGTLFWDAENVENSSLTITMNVASVYSGDSRRDADLVGDDFFEAERFPMAIFQSKSVETTGNGFDVVGDLTLHGITHEVTVPFEIQAVGKMGPGLQRVLAAGEFTFLRSDFDLQRENRMAQALSFVSDEVRMEIELQAVVYSAVSERPFDSRRQPSLGEELLRVVESDGVNAAVDRYRELSQGGIDAFNSSPRELSLVLHKMAAAPESETLGAVILEGTDDETGVAIHMALGDIARSAGDHVAAIHHYQRVVELRPFDSRARELLRHLQ